jgi:hypothetical protein
MLIAARPAARAATNYQRRISQEPEELYMAPARLLDELRIYGNLMQDTAYSLVTLHPLADEDDVLKRLKMTPDACLWCDLYWVYDHWLFFVSIACSTDQPPVATFHRQAGARDGFSFFVRTRACPLTKTTIQTVVSNLAHWIDRHQHILDNLKDERAIRIAENDLAALSA